MRLPNEDKEKILAEEQAWAMLKDWGFTPENCDIERKVLYTFQARWADEFYKGRIILGT
jgi:hypothetical protein